jgi:uncharacterized protein (TIGR00730 family)
VPKLQEVETVVVFGGSGFLPGAPEYRDGLVLGRLLAVRGFRILTGGHGGVMEAVSRGAGEAGGRVLAVSLATWGKPNRYVHEFEEATDLFSRQRLLIEGADAYVALRGGPGTLSEVALVWALHQSGLVKSPRPIVLIGGAWRSIVNTWRAELCVTGEDCDLIDVVDDPVTAVEVLSRRIS